MHESSSGETLYRLADGLFPVRLEPGKPLLMGREGSPLLIELRTRSKNGMDAIIVYHPSGERPSGEAVAHALEPLSMIAGDPVDPPPDAPPASWAFRSLLAAESQPAAATAPRAGVLDTWLDDRRLEAMLWANLDSVREEGKSERDVIMVVFDGGTSPGFEVLTLSMEESHKTATRDEAERRARSTVAQAAAGGSRLVFQIVDTPGAVRETLAHAGVLETWGPRLDAALATVSDVPDRQVRAALLDDGGARARLVSIRPPWERAAEAEEEEKDAILQSVLDEVGEEVRDLHAERRKAGNAAHNLALLVEEDAAGSLKPLVAMRSVVARAIEMFGGEKAKPIVKELGKSAPAGMTHAVFAMRRGEKIVLIHRMTVVQGAGKN